MGVFAVLLLIALSSGALPAQTPTLKHRTKEEREQEYAASHRITLNIQVTDAVGKPVSNLSARDFAVFDNHQPKKIASFHFIDGQAMNDSTRVVFVLDAVNSTSQALETEREGLFKMLAREHGPLPYQTSIVLFTSGHLKATGLTTDRNGVGRAYVGMTKNLRSNACSPVDSSVAQAVEGGGAGALGASGIGDRAVGVATCLETHFKDSISALDGIAQQQKAGGGRTLLIWVGAGWPLLSDPEFQRLSPKAQKEFFDEVVRVMHDLRSAQVTVDAVAPRDGTREAELARVDLKTLIAGAASPQSAGPSNLGLQILAHQTGGRVMTESKDITADLDSCVHDADGYYTLTFDAALLSSGMAELHSIEVKVTDPSATVRTMTEYYAEP